MIIGLYVAAAVVGYLLGSIPFGLLISKLVAKTDVREVGSGKTGATNVIRVAGKKAGVMVLILDLLKGVLAVVLAGLIFRGDYLAVEEISLLWMSRSAQVLAALAAIAGHSWPIFAKFRGGRGVATFFGGLVALCPPAALFGVEVLIIGAGLTRYMSLGSIAGAVAAYAILVPLTIISGFPIEYLIYALVGAIFIIVMHRDNIVRLLASKERKLGEKVETGNINAATNPRNKSLPGK